MDNLTCEYCGDEMVTPKRLLRPARAGHAATLHATQADYLDHRDKDLLVLAERVIPSFLLRPSGRGMEDRRFLIEESQ
jgi:hypothetical protein